MERKSLKTWSRLKFPDFRSNHGIVVPGIMLSAYIQNFDSVLIETYKTTRTESAFETDMIIGQRFQGKPSAYFK